MLIPNDIVQQIFYLDIVDVISQYITINKRGAGYLACCPFHNEKTPSFNVSPSKGVYKCFGCGKGGTNVQFVMEHEGLDYREALIELANKFNIEIPQVEQTPEEIQAEKHRESIFTIMDAAQKHYFDWQKDANSSVLVKFLKDRKIDIETAIKFGIGYCSDNSNIDKYGYNRTLLAECGIEYSGRPVFADRITFPIHNTRGQLVAFTARSLSGAEVNTAKYINTKTYQYYQKSEILYNLNRSKNEIRRLDHALLLEGQMDVIALDQAGILNTVGVSGTAFTEEQAQILRKFTKNITVIFDGDKAGIAALEKSLPILLKYGFDIFTLVLPNGQDPDEYIKAHNAEAFHEYMKTNSVGFMEQVITMYADDWNSGIIGKAKVCNTILYLLTLVTSTTEKHLYLEKFVALTGIPFAAMQPQLTSLIIPRQSPKKQA